MALVETRDQHRPLAAVGAIREIALGPDQKLERFAKLRLFDGILDAKYETRPGGPGGKPITLLVKDALIEHGEFYEAPAGTICFQEGSFGEHLYVLLRGAAASSTSYALDSARNATVEIESMSDGDFFGEHSALSMNAHLISVRITAPSFLLLIPQFIVQELVANHDRFRAAIMGQYVRRALRTLIRRIPMLRYASDPEFETLLRGADLRTYKVGDIVFEEGDPSDAVYVVNEGFVKISRSDGEKSRMLAYLVQGDCFGETGALSGAARAATASAVGEAEALVIPAADFRRIVQNNPAAQAEANALEASRKLDADMVANVTFIGRRLEFKAEVMTNLDVIVIDENLCVRCDNCVTSCAAAHEDGFSRLIRKGVTFEEFLLPTACRACQDPACLLCKSGGIKRDQDGDIYFTESCIGCSGCAQRCPYGNITMVDTAEMGKPAVPTLIDVVLGRKSKPVAMPGGTAGDQRPKLKKIPVKCDMDKGHLFPACVNNCPTGAILRYRADELDRIMSRKS
ncbi:MAG TPA: cyclic nucleotide-binding domain-containing protein [Candidatus Binatia bacterium]|nr:cyclic nucleotide-binding domain-containing protein [Candidatus Binatia bacterium]